jgi:hypothetical protein
MKLVEIHNDSLMPFPLVTNVVHVWYDLWSITLDLVTEHWLTGQFAARRGTLQRISW